MRHSPLVSLAGLLLSVGCQSSGPERPAALAVGYVGPATLNLRKEIPLDAPVVATVKHGEKLEVMRRRRVFLQVRTAKGQVGWTNERLLLSAGKWRICNASSSRPSGCRRKAPPPPMICSTCT